MPVTASGTPYTVHSIDLGAPHGLMYYAIGDAFAASPARSCILYAHGSNGAPNQFATLGAWAGLRDWIIDNGWAWVEGSGGAALGGQNWGNVAARAAYLAYLERARTAIQIGKVVLLGRSMGGLITAWLYARSGVAFDGWINNSGVSTLLEGSLSDPDLTKRSSGEYFKTGTYPAWGVSNLSQLEAAAAAADAIPENWAPSVWTAKKILCCYGDADTTVPWTPRGAAPLREIWAGNPAVDLASVRVGGDHSGTNGSYLDLAAMVPFLTAIGGAFTPEPETPEYFRVRRAYLVESGERYRYSPKPHQTVG